MGLPKALLRDPVGVPYLDRVVGCLLDGGCATVTVVLGASADEARTLLEEAGWAEDDAVAVVEAADWATGMGASLRAGLSSLSSSDAVVALVTLVDLPDVTAVWQRDGDHYDRVTPVRWDRMHGAEKLWFATKAQELVDTQAADYGPDLVATLPDDTTYSVLGDHGGIQRSSQQVPIVFAGANTSHQDLRAEVRSVDIMPTILRAMGIAATHPMDGTAYELPVQKGGRP